jgi:DNA-binding transcriptional LysR family regulator
MDLSELRVFMTVAAERSFSRAAEKLHRTQPAVSQAIRRLEEQLGARLFDRSERNGRLTDAGQLLLDYADRLARLTGEAESAVRQLRDLERGRVVIGTNEGAVHVLMPILTRFQAEHPALEIEVRRVPARQIPAEVLAGTLDLGVLTFQPAERGLESITIGSDELVLLVPPSHRFAGRRQARLSDLAGEVIIAHNDPSPARELVLRSFEQHRAPVTIRMSLPSLDAIKRAVEASLGVALLPRRCALAEITRGQLVAVSVAGLRLPRHVRLVYAKTRAPGHATSAFLCAARTEVEEQRRLSGQKPRRYGSRSATASTSS